MSFSRLGFSPETTQFLKDEFPLQYYNAASTQHRTIPHVLAGRDVLVSSVNASEHSLVFLLPILQKFLTNPKRGNGTRALILGWDKSLLERILEDCRKFFYVC
jgi:superfamily II DNA/RNA helicase